MIGCIALVEAKTFIKKNSDGLESEFMELNGQMSGGFYRVCAQIDVTFYINLQYARKRQKLCNQMI